MSGHMCVGVTSEKMARAHTLRTHVSEDFLHAPFGKYKTISWMEFG
jgi:hypothetical protein